MSLQSKRRHIGREELQIHSLFTSAQYRGECSASCPGCLNPSKSSHCAWDWKGPKHSLDITKYNKSFSTWWKLNNSSVTSPQPSHYTDWATSLQPCTIMEVPLSQTFASYNWLRCMFTTVWRTCLKLPTIRKVFVIHTWDCYNWLCYMSATAYLPTVCNTQTGWL